MQLIFGALSDETRRAILEALREGPQTSGQLADRFDTSWPTISRHLAALRHAGLVVSERRGQEIVYELNTTVFEDFVQHLITWMPKPAARRRAARRQTAKESA